MIAFRVENARGKGPFTRSGLSALIMLNWTDNKNIRPNVAHPNPADDGIVEDYDGWHDPFPDPCMLFGCPDIGSLKHWFEEGVWEALKKSGYSLYGLRLKKGKLGKSGIQLGYYPKDVTERVEFDLSEKGLMAASNWASAQS